MILCPLSVGEWVRVLIYAARLAEEDASMPVTWWYKPIFSGTQSLFMVLFGLLLYCAMLQGDDDL